ncbi:GNAT family acetyltransferase [Legionella gratiana]|uniref:GNAT family acetyltransferase n=1 Tax=Legionella gratiana TaxID=45066 RepID=A0A378J9A5_9GAMM|nr:hypothetical protein [Legionella gratiana]KTD10846.1 GNAT family acetyltransferase [Legionella gratiana]STX44049.1 GNAT family acetyltransferase [Legionella gratiana]
MKQLESLAATPKPMVIKSLELSDILFLDDAFQNANWPKPASLFEAYYQEQQNAERVIWLPISKDRLPAMLL